MLNSILYGWSSAQGLSSAAHTKMPTATGDTVSICDSNVALAEMAQSLPCTRVPALLEQWLDARQTVLGCTNGSKYLFLSK